MVAYDEMYGEVIRKEKSEDKVRIIYLKYDGDGHYETMEPLSLLNKKSFKTSFQNFQPTMINTTQDIFLSDTVIDEKEENVTLFGEVLQTKNTDVLLVKPICFWKIDGRSG